MKITFEDVLSRKEWLHRELMNSLNSEIIEKAMDDRFYDVKLVVNGVEIEPCVFNDIMNGIEKYIDKEAKSLIEEKLDGVDNEINDLISFISVAKDKIIDKMNLKLGEDY